MLHIVPKSIHRVRYGGIFHGKRREPKLDRCRELLIEYNEKTTSITIRQRRPFRNQLQHRQRRNRRKPNGSKTNRKRQSRSKQKHLLQNVRHRIKCRESDYEYRRWLSTNTKRHRLTSRIVFFSKSIDYTLYLIPYTLSLTPLASSMSPLILVWTGHCGGTAIQGC